MIVVQSLPVLRTVVMEVTLGTPHFPRVPRAGVRQPSSVNLLLGGRWDSHVVRWLPVTVLGKPGDGSPYALEIISSVVL